MGRSQAPSGRYLIATSNHNPLTMAADQNQPSEFYIGYFPKAPASYRKKVRLFVIVLLLAVPLTAFLLVAFQRGFIASTYDYANLTELTGVLINSPFPALQIEVNDAQGNQATQTIPIVAFGKLGGQTEVARVFQEPFPLTATVTVKGNLIFYDGKTLLEVKEWGEWKDNLQRLADPLLVASQVSLCTVQIPSGLIQGYVFCVLCIVQFFCSDHLDGSDRYLRPISDQ